MTSEPPKPAKRVRHPEQTRQNILDAATLEFSTMGLKGARTASIAKRAGANAQAIFHHFRSKDALYTAVVVSLFRTNWFLESRERLLAQDPRKAIVEIMDYMMDRAHRDPTFIAILLDANMHSAKHLHGVPEIARYYADVLETIGSVLRRGEAMGLLYPTEPAFFYIMLMGALGSPTNARALFSAALQKDYRRDEEIARWYAAFKELVLRGITRPEAPPPAADA